jgi:hypothetical protein
LISETWFKKDTTATKQLIYRHSLCNDLHVTRSSIQAMMQFYTSAASQTVQTTWLPGDARTDCWWANTHRCCSAQAQASCRYLNTGLCRLCLITPTHASGHPLALEIFMHSSTVLTVPQYSASLPVVATTVHAHNFYQPYDSSVLHQSWVQRLVQQTQFSPLHH